ncbi:MAG TPA: hypothetical protein VIV11_35070 [Kofleriaceae bacterium]
MRLVVVSFVLGLAACNTPPEQEARDLCTVICKCATASPTRIELCVEECTEDIAPLSLPDACVECVYQYSQSCGDFEAHCEAACDQPQPQP